VKLRADAVLPFPRPVVFAAYRDRLLDLLPYLANVRRIERGECDERGAVAERVNVWHGGGEIPAVARAILSESMLSWTDRARWDEGAYVCHWRVETHAFTEAVRCEGRHTFLETPEGTRIETRGDIVIDAAKVRAVPRLLASRVGRAIEDMLASKIQPNLAAVNEGLAKLLAAEGAGRD
jgi:hypothetical protein